MNISKLYILFFSAFILGGCAILNKNINQPTSAKNKKSNKELFDAITHGNTERVKYLINTDKADASTTNSFGNTALIEATQFGHTSIAEILIKAGANINAKDSRGMTALMMAAQFGRTSIAETLIRVGAEVSGRTRSFGRTALMMAATSGHTSIVEKLIKAGADVNVKDHRSMTALMMAAQFGYTSVVETLIKAGAEVSGRTRSFGRTALMMAATGGHTSIVEILIRVGADTSVKDHRGMTALDLTKEMFSFKKDHPVIKVLEKAMR